MKKISKTKNKSKKTTTTKRARKPQERTYQAYILGLVLITLLAGEFALITSSTSHDWKVGMQILDLSDAVPQLIADVKFVSEPAVFALNTIDEFYNHSAVAASQILDMSDSDSSPMMLVYGINDFYDLASKEMASVLDLSGYIDSSFEPQVAGISVSQ
jgi:hypothetical protein